MKANKLLKVLSAATIISTLAVVENSTQSNTTFAIENNAVAAKDIKNLPDGEYNITAEALKFYGAEGEASMAAAGLDTTKTKLIVRNGQYFVNVSFKPITFGGLNGYLGDLKYYDGDKTHANRNSIQNNEFNPAAIVEYYSTAETDNFVETYKKKFPGRTAYPKTLSYSVDKNKIDSNNKLETYTEVYVPVMASIGETFGTQRMILKFDLSNALNMVANTQPAPAKPAKTEATVKPETPENTQPSNKPTEPTNYIFETSMVLHMDNGESVNRHSLAYHMDYKNHRIDKDTSGILVVAKSKLAFDSLKDQFSEHSIKRWYYALVYNNFPDDSGEIDRPIGRDSKNRLRRAIDGENPKRALTRYEGMERFGNIVLIKAILETGRTHQIRVHLTSIGHPLVGDTLYGSKKDRFGADGQILHAAHLEFVHPRTGKSISFDSEPPEYFTKAVEKAKRLAGLK